MPSRSQVMSEQRALQFIDLYNDHSLSADVICTRMGWSTQYPRQRVQSTLTRLRERGYDIPPRGESFKPAMTVKDAQERLDTVTGALRQKGFRIIYRDGALVVTK